jgi:hypothetical protein
MVELFRLGILVLAVAAVALGAALLEPAWAHDLGVDRDSLAAIPHALFDPPSATQSGEDRERYERLLAKGQVSDDLIAGRLTLFEAAARFRRIEQGREHTRVEYYPGDSEEERLCRRVINGARAQMSQRYPEGADEFVERLEAELQLHKERHNGTVVLPDAGKGRGIAAAKVERGGGAATH